MKNLKKHTCLIAAILGASCVVSTPSRVFASAENEERYYDSPVLLSDYVSEDIYYTTRTELAEYNTTNNVPFYSPHTDLSNSCGATAGSIIIGFYDKYFENLIPNYTSYYTASGKYRSVDTTYIPALQEDLYTLMRTNVDDVGVSRTDCLNGLQDYVEGKGESLTYTCLKSSASSFFNETQFINAINNNHPVLLFCNEAKMVDIGLMDTYDHLVYSTIANNHIMVAYGYYKVSYNINGTIRTNTYMNVACGLHFYSGGYALLDDHSWLNGAYIVEIS